VHRTSQQSMASIMATIWTLSGTGALWINTVGVCAMSLNFMISPKSRRLRKSHSPVFNRNILVGHPMIFPQPGPWQSVGPTSMKPWRTKDVSYLKWVWRPQQEQRCEKTKLGTFTFAKSMSEPASHYCGLIY
jgi:hypothetical protein